MATLTHQVNTRVEMRARRDAAMAALREASGGDPPPAHGPSVKLDDAFVDYELAVSTWQTEQLLRMQGEIDSLKPSKKGTVKS